MPESINELSNNSEFMKLLLEMKADMGVLSNEQKNIKTHLVELKVIREKDAERIANLERKIDSLRSEIDNKKETIKENRNSLFKWIGMLVAIGTLVASLTYEIGLRSPIPLNHSISKNISL